MTIKALINRIKPSRRFMGRVVAVALWLFIFVAVYRLVVDIVPHGIVARMPDGDGVDRAENIAFLVALFVASGVTNLSIKGYRVSDPRDD